MRTSPATCTRLLIRVSRGGVGGLERRARCVGVPDSAGGAREAAAGGSSTLASIGQA